MKALFLLIALYTISGKQAVPSGDIPEGSACEYTQTGNRSGQMTADNSLMLQLTGYTGCTLQGVTLSMKSNTSSGAGWLRLTIGDEMVWEIEDAPFSSAEWAGTYSTDWVDISHALSGRTIMADEEIQLRIGASANSLYLESIAIEYTAPQPVAYTVSFDTHIPQTVAPIVEQQAGAGIILPDLAFSDSLWMFSGWALMPTMETIAKPVIWQAGETYVPQQNCTLHAVYVSKDEGEEYWWPADELSTGDYLLTLYIPGAYTFCQATGAVQSGLIRALLYYFYDEVVDPIPMQMGYTATDVYTLTMLTDSTLTLKHKETNTDILLDSGNKFKTSGSGSWKVRSEYNETDQMTHHHLSAQRNGVEYVVTVGQGLDVGLYFRPMTGVTDYGLLLYALDDEPIKHDTKYTSYPYGQTAVIPVVTDGTTPYRIPMGPCTLIIRNGQKTLQLNE